MADPQTAVARQERRAELRELEFGRQGGELMVPKDGSQLVEMARIMAGSDLMVRDFYRGNQGACAALIMLCAPYGLNPFQVSWKTYKASKNADAPISFEAQLVNAMVNLSAPIKGRLRYAYEGEGEARSCTVTGTDRETGADITYTTPPIGKIAVKNSPLWKGDPDQQLGYYAARAWARRHFPELLLGVYARDEIEEARDVTPRPTSRLAERVKAAQEAAVAPGAAEEPQEAAQEAEEAEVMPDLPPEAETAGGTPVGDQWSAGEAAADAGEHWTTCPFDAGDDRADWLAGWAGKRKAMEG